MGDGRMKIRLQGPNSMALQWQNMLLEEVLGVVDVLERLKGFLRTC
jgi:hypothetical protein